MSPRATLPGADELFRRTSAERGAERKAEPAREQESKSTNLQVAPEPQPAETVGKKAPKHDEKVTFYCTADDLMGLESARLRLRRDFKLSADRGRIIRAALNYVLEDFEARGEDSILLRRLGD